MLAETSILQNAKKKYCVLLKNDHITNKREASKELSRKHKFTRKLSSELDKVKSYLHDAYHTQLEVSVEEK